MARSLDVRVKRLAILGSTGSIGRQALQVVDHYPERLQVISLAAARNLELLAEQAAHFRPELVAIAEPGLETPLRQRIGHLGCRVVSGPSGVRESAALGNVDLVVAGMVGADGLLPVLDAVEAGRDIAFANKEVLVAAGALVTARARATGSTLIPVDSEHSAIFQCLHGQQRHALRRVLLTASGGPFARLSVAELEDVTPERALKHPTWKMGDKVTVDSATLMNKGLEVIEARWLFDLTPDQIDIIIHHQSIVHSMVEFADGSVIAQLGWPSMMTPIQYALLYPDRASIEMEPLDLARVGSLTFADPDFDRFPCLRLARQALVEGNNAAAALNGANEVAVKTFLEGRIGFGSIPAIVEEALNRHEPSDDTDLTAILEADRAGRTAALHTTARLSGAPA